MFSVKDTEDYKKIKELAHSVGVQVSLNGHEVLNIFPFKDSKMLNKLVRIRDESEYTIRAVGDNRNEDACKSLAGLLLWSFICDIDNFYFLMKKDQKTLANVALCLFALVILLIGVIIV